MWKIIVGFVLAMAFTATAVAIIKGLN